MTSKTWLTKNSTQVLLSISRIKGNQTEIWSVNKTSQEKYFSLKIIQKMREKLVPGCFLFFKKA